MTTGISPHSYAITEPLDEIHRGILWPEHMHAGEKIEEWIQPMGAMDYEDVEHYAKHGYNNFGPEWPPHGVVVKWRVRVDPYEIEQ